MPFFIGRKRHLKIKRNLESSILTKQNRIKELEVELQKEREANQPLRDAKDSALRQVEELDAKVKRLEADWIKMELEKEKVKKKFSGQYNILKEVEKPVRELMAIVNHFREQKDDN